MLIVSCRISSDHLSLVVTHHHFYRKGRWWQWKWV